MVTDTKIRLAILDFDGTIADTQTLIVDTMQGVIEELGLEKRTRAQCAAMIGLPLEKTFSTLIPMSDEMTADRIRGEVRQLFRELPARFSLQRETAPLLSVMEERLAAVIGS